MSIKYAILGFLSWRSLTGYDLKKLFTEFMVLYWSGNNNQIYRTLVQLHKEGAVTSETQHQEGKPSRKVYTITDAGRAMLRDWVLTPPNLPQLRHTFLIQLAWADQLAPEELDDLLAAYAEELRVQHMMLQEQTRRQPDTPQRSPRETYLWEMIMDNGLTYYEHEMRWLDRLRQGLEQF